MPRGRFRFDRFATRAQLLKENVCRLHLVGDAIEVRLDAHKTDAVYLTPKTAGLFGV